MSSCAPLRLCTSAVAAVSVRVGVIVALLWGSVTWAQEGLYPIDDIPSVLKAPLRPLAQVDTISFPELDLLQVQQDDEANFQRGVMAPRFAVPNTVALTPQNSGTWEQLDAVTSVWRLAIECPNVKHINLGFTRYLMPEGGRLLLYNDDMSFVVRAFTAADVQPTGELWTPIVVGDKIVVEVTIPTDRVNQMVLVLGAINLGYRGFEFIWNNRQNRSDDGSGTDSGACQIDILCPQGEPWLTEAQAVSRVSIAGTSLCTGFLVNNTANDRKPYLMTAEHCGLTSGNAGTLIAYWNYQNSFCRTPGSAQSGQPGNGSFSTFSSGSAFRASYAPTDFTLVELNSAPNPAWNLAWAGWERASSSASGAGIHHPNSDEKRISLYTSTVVTTSYGGNTSPGNSTHLRVVWSQGTTEPGSSGSPIFNASKRVIGQLHGGGSACGTNQFQPDWYGRFATSWTGGGTNTTRLSNWLDPVGSNLTSFHTVTNAMPANNTCANATLVLAGTYGFNNLTASTTGPDEPTHCNFNGYTNIAYDVWYRYFAQCTGTATVSLCGSSFNTKIAVYPACPAGSGTVIACNSNSCGLQSQVSFPVNNGVLYYLRIGGSHNAAGAGTFTISCQPAPPACPADIAPPGGDGAVGVPDLLKVISSWGPCPPPPCEADIAPDGGDGTVGVPDLLKVISSWGPCP